MFQNFVQFIHPLINSIYVQLCTICLNEFPPRKCCDQWSVSNPCRKLHACTIMRVKLTVKSSLKFLPTPLSTLNIDVSFWQVECQVFFEVFVQPLFLFGKLNAKSSLKFLSSPCFTLKSLRYISKREVMLGTSLHPDEKALPLHFLGAFINCKRKTFLP